MSIDSDDSVEANSSLESMPTHRSEWKQHELLSTILNRYFYVASDMAGGVLPTWVVSPKNDKKIDDCLDEANAYLKKLGWAAKLSQGEEWVVQLFPLPERQFPSLNLTFWMWSFSALTLTLAGAYWMEGLVIHFQCLVACLSLHMCKKESPCILTTAWAISPRFLNQRYLSGVLVCYLKHL
jgi:hypothetical protein